ncbi:hypothetical protein VOLCADRAFT_88016 [Volvox carteri f. nagariensis]|uniref:OCEL domain-containing protein n=1 Tax=Volvox carteri f. nagariensis TaxID=3068 RepID=D8TMU8_VOLCA|nr:uncharacterized protein VOLCADRAFT_88016 [Volvox carteri f. nagariensis]EFJ51188.1 hypothetical protein VOLCADRAFT_88016 [Volvox carteri f. nagariensis]|eukprot:XP_002947655.1 hypothetical protein VOLCADRAFT_88016 [Volvox carteri f. nagariensis]
MAYCFQSGHPLGFAVQLRLTPELKQALINARASGEAVSLRFREDPHREAVLSVAGQEYFFSTAPQAGQVEVVEVTPAAKEARSVACVKHRLTVQRSLDADHPRRGGGGGLSAGLGRRPAGLLDGNQRAGGAQPRTAAEGVTRPPPPPQTAAAASTFRVHQAIPDVLSREGPRLEELISGTSPTAAGGGGGGERGRGGGARYGSAYGQGAAAKRMASCSPDPRTSPDSLNYNYNNQQHHPACQQQQQQQQSYHHHQHSSPVGVGPNGGGGGGGRSSTEDAAATSGATGTFGGQQHAGRAAAAKAAAAAAAAAAAKPKKVVAAPGGPRGLPSYAQMASGGGGGGGGTGGGGTGGGGAGGGQQVSQPLQHRPPAPPKARPASAAAADSGGGTADGGAKGSPSHGRRRAAAEGPPPAKVSAAAMQLLSRRGSEDGGGDGGGCSVGGGSESRMDTDGRGTTAAGTTVTGVTASPDYESALDPEIQAYADPDLDLQEDDKDGEWYSPYVDWKPEPHAAVQSVEQYEQYEREYRSKFEVYHRLNQKYNDVVREADQCRAAVWKRARRNLHVDLGDLRERVAEYVARQGALPAVAQPPQPLQQLQLQPS